MPNVVIQPGGKTVGLYSPAVAVPANSSLMFISGVLSVDLEGQSVGIGDFEAQMRTVFTLLGQTLAAAGSTWSDLVKMTTYLTTADHIDPFYEVREALFSDLYPKRNPPGNTLLVVRRLVRPEFLIEIEGIATTREVRGESNHEFIG